MKFENTEVFNLQGALRGMRNPKNSWDKADSGYKTIENRCYGMFGYTETETKFVIGQNDLKLAKTLIKAGSEHRKFMRQIFVSVDITAPLYWWKEFDTYKVGTVSNSTSTMHKLAETPITIDCFEISDPLGDYYVYDEDNEQVEVRKFWTRQLIPYLEGLRQEYNKTKDCGYWRNLIQLLPESWLQKRTVTMDYENLLAMCSKGQRRFHKLTEWSKAFIEWARELPYAQELIFLDELD